MYRVTTSFTVSILVFSSISVPSCRTSSQQVECEPCPERTDEQARAADGVVEAYFFPGQAFVVGVQYHPEGQTRPAGQHDRLFRAFVEAASTYRDDRESSPGS